MDVDYLNDYYQGNISDAAFLFEVFLNCTVQKFYEFATSVNNKNYSEASRIAHQIIPTFKLVGLTGIAFQLKELEIKVTQSYCIHALSQSISTDFEEAIPIIYIQKAEIDSFLQQQKD